MLLPEWGENSWGREVGWRPEVCLTKAWRPSGLGIQGAARGCRRGGQEDTAPASFEKAKDQGLSPWG